MLMTDDAGLVVVWSGSTPRLDTFRLVAGEPFRFGKQYADATDDRISRTHATIQAELTGPLVTDHSRNGTYVNGRLLHDDSRVPNLPVVLRTGRTISVITYDIRRFENTAVTHRGKLVVAGSLADSVSRLDAAAKDEENVVLLGPTDVARHLARDYATKLGDSVEAYLFMVAADGGVAKHLDGKRPRTVILVLQRPLTLPDLLELAQWLETDVRFVCVAKSLDALKFMPESIVQKLTARVIEIPHTLRFDEIPTVVLDLARTKKPDAVVTAKLIEIALLRAREAGEDRLWLDFEKTLAAWNGESPLRDEALLYEIEADEERNFVQIGGVPRRGYRDRLRG